MKMAEDNTLTDNASIKNENFICGVVEGFYGRPWSTEQRKDIFLKMNKMGLNSFMYAPKDDFKHRAYWRELYTVEEAEHLTNLIQAAKESAITFFYALSPGLDITYSSPKEVSALKRKLEQVSQFGCEAFALLFDDIEPDISETDKEAFQSFGHAQVSVTNEVYQHLSQPRFLFCPTEYCTTRALPNVRNSEYLNTIGSKLMQGIDIMWTGPKVISKDITVQSVTELAEVLHRPPVIWDNLHANDYDQKRLFLGPYCGRSTELIPHLHGIMTNPNCEYETNFIAIHTLGQWSRCSADGKRDLSLNDSVTADIKLETESETGSVEDIPTRMGPNIYHPKKALISAIHDWLPEFSKPKNAYGRLMCPAPYIPTPQFPTQAILNPEDPNFQPISAELVNSLTSPKEILEPMDCNPSPGGSPKHSRGEAMQTEELPDESKRLTFEDVSLLIDLFYLPFEHGTQALHMLQDFCWLKSNGHLVAGKSVLGPEAEEWFTKAAKFNTASNGVRSLFTRLTYCQNRSLLYDLYPYIWDIKGVISMLNSYVQWIALGRVTGSPANSFCPPFTWFSKSYKEAFGSGEQEPWLFRGGLTAEFQRLLPLESVGDLFLYKTPDLPTSKIYTIRPYLQADEEAVYGICRKTCDDGVDGTDVFPDYPNLIGDKLVGGFLGSSPETCFVVEDECGVCGYVLSAIDALQFHKKLKEAWMSGLCNKYPLPKKDNGEMLTPSEELIAGFHNYKTCAPEIIYKHHPSILKMNILPSVVDLSVPKRLMTCVLSALKANGSHGVFCEVTVGDKNILDFYAKLGFLEITLPSYTNDDVFYLGRTF